MTTDGLIDDAVGLVGIAIALPIAYGAMKMTERGMNRVIDEGKKQKPYKKMGMQYKMPKMYKYPYKMPKIKSPNWY